MSQPMTPEREADLATFAREQAAELGLDETQQYVEHIHSNNAFKASHVATTKLWVSGLSLAHDQLVARSLTGLGYQVDVLAVPDHEALQFGKEFGNKSQCNPTWYTVGNLVKHLVHMRDRDGVPTEDIIAGNAFLTAGACGPCRFGMYATEYRKALRDAGFDGFRVLFFQSNGGLAQATGEAAGLKIDKAFALALVSALFAGDVLNLIGYRIRPYEVEPGATKAAILECKRVIGDSLEKGQSTLMALWTCNGILKKVKVDRTLVKPRVSVIGEFWAMTTEGDGNYELYDFLESQGAEVEIQPLINWLLYLLWEKRFDLDQRAELKEADIARKGLHGVDPTFRYIGNVLGETVLRGLFYAYARAIGLVNHDLPDMDQIARLAGQHYDNHLRGGEGHMEVGKLLHHIEDHIAHFTISVKPFGCMPSSGVSDGVQSKVIGQHPDALFLPIETTGDGKVNVQSRVQMMLFKARQKARTEYEKALADVGMDEAAFRAKLAKSSYAANPTAHPKHKAAGAAANLVYALG